MKIKSIMKKLKIVFSWVPKGSFIIFINSMLHFDEFRRFFNQIIEFSYRFMNAFWDCFNDTLASDIIWTFSMENNLIDLVALWYQRNVSCLLLDSVSYCFSILLCQKLFVTNVFA